MVQDYLNFLNSSEIENIRQEVHNLKDYWKHSSQYKNSNLLPYKNTPILEALFDQYRAEYLLGDPLYRLEGNKEDINLDIQLLLLSKFSWVYSKLINKIQQITSTPTELEIELTIPGFHVFSGHAQPFNIFNYHVDTSILDFYPNVDVNKIKSFVLLIESKGTTPCLDYESGIKEYEFGTLHIWDGNINHRMGEFELKDGDSRITLQGHFYYDELSKTNKLYF